MNTQTASNTFFSSHNFDIYTSNHFLFNTLSTHKKQTNKTKKLKVITIQHGLQINWQKTSSRSSSIFLWNFFIDINTFSAAVSLTWKVREQGYEIKIEGSKMMTEREKRWDLRGRRGEKLRWRILKIYQLRFCGMLFLLHLSWREGEIRFWAQVHVVLRTTLQCAKNGQLSF